MNTAVPVAPAAVLNGLLLIVVLMGEVGSALLLAFCESTRTLMKPIEPAFGVKVLPLTATSRAPPTSTPTSYPLNELPLIVMGEPLAALRFTCNEVAEPDG